MDNHGSLLHLELSRSCLTVGGLWRLSHQSRIVASSAAANDGPDLPLDFLVGKSIESVTIHGVFNDIRLEFTDDVVLEVFADSAIYETWVLRDEGGVVIGSGPGINWFRL
jgi:hypothetical protein